MQSLTTTEFAADRIRSLAAAIALPLIGDWRRAIEGAFNGADSHHDLITIYSHEGVTHTSWYRQSNGKWNVVTETRQPHITVLQRKLESARQSGEMRNSIVWNAGGGTKMDHRTEEGHIRPPAGVEVFECRNPGAYNPSTREWISAA